MRGVIRYWHSLRKFVALLNVGVKELGGKVRLFRQYPLYNIFYSYNLS
jgi:hypothetical protein